MIEVVHGDCLKVIPGLADRSVDLVFADLPYGEIRARWDRKIDLGRLWAGLARVLRPGAAAVFTASFKFAMELVASNPRWFRYDLVWDKVLISGMFNSGRQPLRRHELLLVFCDRAPRYFPVMSVGEPLHASGRDIGKSKGGYLRRPRAVGALGVAGRFSR